MTPSPAIAVSVGTELPTRLVQPTEIQLFRFSAATRNPHRIHYDRPYAQVEGYPDILVQSHLHASYLAHYVQDYFGADARLARFSWRNRSVATPRDTLTIDGTVTRVSAEVASVTYEVDLVIRNQDGASCVTGSATVVGPASAAEA